MLGLQHDVGWRPGAVGIVGSGTSCKDREGAGGYGNGYPKCGGGCGSWAAGGRGFSLWAVVPWELKHGIIAIITGTTITIVITAVAVDATVTITATAKIIKAAALHLRV